MKILAGFTLLAVWLCAALDVTQAQDETVYFTLGGELVLRPRLPVSLTSITWKNQGSLVAEWVEGFLTLVYYGKFKNDTVLDVSSGELKIRNMAKDHAGKYTVEVNNMDHPVGYNAVELKRVPQPEVILRPLTCKKETLVCTCSCEGDVTGAEPVTYYWKMGNGQWTESRKDVNITNDEETQGAETFSCKLKNPLSEKESKELPNPFYTSGPSIGLILGVILLFVLGVGAAVVIAYKKGKFSSFCGSNRGAAEPTPKDSEDKALKAKESDHEAS